jgi:hypothetical protein
MGVLICESMWRSQVFGTVDVHIIRALVIREDDDDVCCLVISVNVNKLNTSNVRRHINLLLIEG